MRTYNNIQEIMQANRFAGQHFFSAGAMRFFNSRIEETPLIHGNLFITSEQFDKKSERLFTVRCALENGSIESVSKFQAFETKKEAIEWANNLPKRIQEAIESANKEFNTGMPNGIGFVSMAMLEPTNSKGKFSKDSFAGACTWLLINWNDTNLTHLKRYAQEFEESLQAGFNNVPTNKDATL